VPRVTVAVPVKDRRERMLRCLDALLALDHPDYEVVVLDNGSTDGTAEACRERAAGARVPVRVEVLPGSVGALRNHAARTSDAELIAFTDSDCAPEPGWLTAGTGPFADPRVGVVCGPTLPVEEPEPGWFATIDVRAPSGSFEASNVLFRRAALAATEGFDEVVGHFWEDTAAGRAVLRAGWAAAWAPDAVVRHDVTYPGFAWHLRRQLRHANAARVVRRYPELRRELLFGRLFLTADTARFDAAVLGVIGAAVARHPAPLALALPYAHARRGRLRSPKALAQGTLYDAARLAGLLRGAVRHRAIVL
jgi:glycosyltransferase involved in cell wall biosynthesis